MKTNGMDNQTVSAFTLIELLVVVAIIAVLMGIMLPSIGQARIQAKKTVCGANLRSVGQAIQVYMSEYNEFYPPMAVKPVGSALPLPDPRPAMCDILDTYVSSANKVFLCPSDHIRQSPPSTGETTYFEWQGSSYEPRTFMSVVDGSGRWLLSRENNALGKNQAGEIEQLFNSASTIALIHDYEPFHSKKVDDDRGRMTLFADFHVAPLEN